MGQPALDPGCGDGDPLLDLIERGLDVEGLAASANVQPAPPEATDVVFWLTRQS